MNFNNSEKEKEKGTFPPSPPYKEKEKEKAVKASVLELEQHAREGSSTGTRTSSSTAPCALSTSTSTVGLRLFSGSSSKSVNRVDHKFILDGSMEDGRRNDPVQMAMKALDIPAQGNGDNGVPYNNARIMRYYVFRLGEENFRQLVYQQWRENTIDHKPRNSVTAFMGKLYDALYGGAR